MSRQATKRKGRAPQPSSTNGTHHTGHGSVRYKSQKYLESDKCETRCLLLCQESASPVRSPARPRQSPSRGPNVSITNGRGEEVDDDAASTQHTEDSEKVGTSFHGYDTYDAHIYPTDSMLGSDVGCQESLREVTGAIMTAQAKRRERGRKVRTATQSRYGL